MIDLDTLEPRDPFSKLKKSYVIFICTKKPKGLTPVLPIYTFKSVCKEDPTVDLGDDAAKIILNADCHIEGVSDQLRNFLEFLKTRKVGDSFTERLHDAVQKSKNAEEWRKSYMRLLEKFEEERADERKSILLELVHDGDLSPEKAAARLGWTAEKVRKESGLKT